MADDLYIHYLVLALTKKEVETAIVKLDDARKATLHETIEWIKNNGNINRIYDEKRENWKPFAKQGDSSFANILKRLTDKAGQAEDFKKIKIKFMSESDLINILKNIDDSNKMSLPIRNAGLDICFIDVLGFVFKKFEQIADNMDKILSNKVRFCFVSDYCLPIKVQNELETEMARIWQLVRNEYKYGGPHRIATRIDDLKNFVYQSISYCSKQDHAHSKPEQADKYGKGEGLPWSK